MDCLNININNHRSGKLGIGGYSVENPAKLFVAKGDVVIKDLLKKCPQGGNVIVVDGVLTAECGDATTPTKPTPTTCPEGQHLESGECVNDSITPTPSTPVSGGKVYYCHLGKWTKEFNATCDNLNFPDGYKWEQARVCHNGLIPSPDICEPSSASPAYNLPLGTGDCFDYDNDKFYTCMD